MPPEVTLLGVETSCDETGAAVVRLRDGRLEVLSNVVRSQVEVHAEYGGVVPELASRAHMECIGPVLRTALRDAGVERGSLCAVAAGVRPGLIGSLLVGTSAAKSLAWGLGVPFLGVDHVAAHLTGGLLDQPPASFPALGLVVSGGHTSLFLMESPTRMERLGRTIDDAVGEAFDKAATVLGLRYPGGPEVDRLAEACGTTEEVLPVPRVSVEPGGGIAFSFSGLKTALLHQVRGTPPAPRRPAPPPPPPLTEPRRAALAWDFRRAAVEAVMRGLEAARVRAVDRAAAGGAGGSLRPVTLLVGGGVAANALLRRRLAEWCAACGLELRLPPLRYCLDNAAMIAGLAAFRAAAGERDPWWLPAQPLSALR